MNLKPISDEQAQEAVDALVYHNNNKAAAARALGVPRETFRDRVIKAVERGITSKYMDATLVAEPAPRSVGRKHLVIPDGQVKEGVDLSHWEWIGNYIVDKKPDVVVNIGDFADMPSLSSYDKGKRGYEGRRYISDIKAAHLAMRKLMGPIEAHNRVATQPYVPEMHITLGNHEERILRATELDAMLHGTIKIEDLQYEEFGWNVHDFLKVVEIDGIHYSHYFTTGVKGYPVTSARALATKKHVSCTMGHNQKTDVDMSQTRADGKQIIALFSGICYLHDEQYLGPQGNNDKRQVWVCHEVEDGDYDLMQVSLKYLKRRYS